MNKVKYGLKNVHYAVATIAADGTADYGTVKAWPGAVNLSLATLGEPTNFFADDTIYFVAPPAAGYQGDFVSAIIPESAYTDILNDAVDSKNVSYEADGTPIVHFALMFEFAGDEKATKHVLYNCTLTRPALEGSTKEDTTTPQTSTVQITASTIYVEALKKWIVKANTKSNTDATVDAGWYSDVYIPAAPTTPQGQDEG